MTSDDARHEPIKPDHQLALVEMQKQLARYEETLANLGARAAADDDDEAIDLRELWSVLVRRRWTVIISAVLVLVTTIVATAMMTPIYRATTVVQIEREAGKVVEYQDEVTAESSTAGNDFYQTQYELLKSRSLAKRVADQLGLRPVQAGSAGEARGSGLSGLLAYFTGGDDSAAQEAAPVYSEPDPERVAGRVQANLSIEPIRNSRLVRVHYDSADPAQAALVVNAVARAFIDMNLERRFEASTYAKSFLEDRIRQVRADLEDSERALLAYTQERGIVNQEDKIGLLMEKLRELTSAKIAVEADRIRAEAQYQEMLQVEDAGLAEAMDSQVIQQLKERRTDLQSQYRQLGEIYKPGYPRMQQLTEQLAQIDEEIAAEIGNIRDGIRVQYQAKLREEAKLADSIAATRAEIIDLNENSTDFQTLKREVDTNRELYDGLLQRMKEVGVAAGITTNNISIVDAAKVPGAPYKPSMSRNALLALVLGLLAGGGLAFLFEMLDDSVKSSADLEKLVDKPVLGIIPKVGGKKSDPGLNVALQSYLDPTSALAEAHRSMRTALMFSTSEGAPKVIHFTSVSQGEGKTTTAVNTAINFAQTGSTVLLIDGDLRNPSLHKAFNRPNDNGLTNYLSGDVEPGRVTQPTGVDKLFVMTAGPIPPNPAELLHGAKMLDLATLAAKRFDYVIIDGPPLLGLADALLLADVAKATLLVAAAGQARVGSIEAGLKRLRHSRANVLGTVLTKFDLSKSSYGYGYGYDYAYSYSYGGEDADAKSA